MRTKEKLSFFILWRIVRVKTYNLFKKLYVHFWKKKIIVRTITGRAQVMRYCLEEQNQLIEGSPIPVIMNFYSLMEQVAILFLNAR